MAAHERNQVSIPGKHSELHENSSCQFLSGHGELERQLRSFPIPFDLDYNPISHETHPSDNVRKEVVTQVRRGQDPAKRRLCRMSVELLEPCHHGFMVKH